jgi:hypothetical protein
MAVLATIPVDQISKAVAVVVTASEARVKRSSFL